jgi:lantibiotic modifying enzyme
LAQPRAGDEGRRSWAGQGFVAHPLTGMSHGAAGFAYALATLAQATGRTDFAEAAAECLAFENTRYDADRRNWPDLRGAAAAFPCQWCHGAAGIGLARAASLKSGVLKRGTLTADISNAVDTAQKSFPGALDTLCCGTLGNIEFLCEAGNALGRNDLRQLAAKQLSHVLASAATAGDFRWNSGRREFNLGLFRGLAGVGYTALRQVERSLPNVLIWE